MDSKDANQIFDLPPDELRPIASQVLATEAIPFGKLSVEKIGHSAGQATVGIYRVVGQAKTAAGEQSWCAVAKVLGPPAVELPGMTIEAQREVEVYHSGVFAKLRGGIRAARCYGIQVRNDLQLMWLEDLSQEPQSSWPPEQFIETAYHLGQFNAYWPEAELPQWAWLNHKTFGKFFMRQPFQGALERLPELQSHPLITQVAPPDVAAETLQFWAESDRLFEKIEQLPKGICHLDCHPGNLFPMQNEAGQTYTVAIDWAEVGIGAYGIDVGHILTRPIKQMKLPFEEMKAVVAQTFESYVNGLTEAGWVGDKKQVKYTYLVRLGCEAFRNITVVILAVENPKIREVIEYNSKASLEETAESRAEAQRLLLSFKDEALQLLDYL